MNIWKKLSKEATISPLSGQLFRVVESQEQIATTHLVNNVIEDQILLEDMLNNSKPAIPSDWEKHYHYLLYTPFRYPPLPYGSRFGTRFEPSLFYASQSKKTACTEMAYYRFLFWHDMVEKPARSLLTQHTIFNIGYQAQAAIALHKPPFNQYEDLLTHPSDYKATQALGLAMRDAGVELFEFQSARDPDGINVALFSPTHFSSTKPDALLPAFCETKDNQVVVKDDAGELYSFNIESFLN